ncbi:MAG: Ig-like domain-containing protein [Acidobacteriota bacterium]|nr:Ig-like domain-containing protein [Acidobacteriota bacterium]
MIKVTLLAILAVSTVWAQTTVRFSADSGDGSYSVGPFPTNALTTPDANQLTGLRVNLPESEGHCTAGINPLASPVCSNTALLNLIDGFSVNPRLMVCFSRPVNVNTLSAGISIVPVSVPGHNQHGVAAAGIGQIIFDPSTNCAYAKPSQVLAQDTSYLLVVTDSVQDAAGKSVGSDPAYTACVGSQPSSYCDQLADAVQHSHPIPKGRVVASSLFTTMTVTNWLEQAREFVDSTPSLVIPLGSPSSFQLSTVKAITWNPAQTGGITSQDIPLGALQGVDSVAFGLLCSPNYLAPTALFPLVPGTITGSPSSPKGYAPVSYHVFLPPTPAAQGKHGNNGKIPVVIYGHGLGDSQFGAPTFIASTFAKNGFATLAFEVTGHGFGQGSTVTVDMNNGTPSSTEWTPGRGIQLSSAGIGPTDGCIVPGAFGIRDCGRQTAVDLFALVHAIQSTQGLGLNLDPNRIYYVGQSLGSIAGTLFMAVEPTVNAAVLNGAGGTEVDIARLAITARPLGLGYLMSLKQPLLFNVPALGAPPEDYFDDALNDNYVFRDRSPVRNAVPGALADQAAFEAADWIGMVGDPLAFAPHLTTSPLTGVPAKNVLFQFGLGDLEVPNPTESAVVRAANAQSSTSFFRFDVAASKQKKLLRVYDPAVSPEPPFFPILPHRVLSNPTIFTGGNEAERSVALAEQQQTADYFSSNGTRISDPDIYLTLPFSAKDNLFINGPAVLPDELNYLQIPQ